MTNELPEGWAEAEVGAVLNLVNGFAFKPSHWGKIGLPIIRIQNLNNPDAPYNYYDGELPDRIRVQKNDLLFAWSGTPGTSFGAHIWNGGDAWLNQHIFNVDFDGRLFDASFLKHAINQNLNHYISDAHGGAGLAHITKRKFEASTIRVAPFPEQQRIVERLETLLGKVEQCKERMAKIPVFLKCFRQSVLAAACSGRLTADWREGHNPPWDIDLVLESIFQRRISTADTVREKERLVEVFQQAEEEDSDTLPTEWKYVYLNKLCDSFDYGSSSKSLPAGTVPVLRMGNIQRGKIDWNDLVYTSDADEIQKYALHGKTVLFNRTNSPELVGKTAIYREEHPAIFAGYLIRINPLPELDPEYLNLCLNTNYAREFCQQVKTDGVSQSNINAQKLGRFAIPFCSLEEQREIVERATKLLALADRIEARYQGAKKQMDNLTQSILAKAFRGELVPTEAELAAREGRDYESATQLLERIRTTRPGIDSGGSNRKGGRKRHSARHSSAN